MKNPLEYTLLEIEALMALDDQTQTPQKEFSALVSYVHFTQALQKRYEVQRETKMKEIEKQEISKRQARRLDDELLDSCEIVTVEAGANG